MKPPPVVMTRGIQRVGPLTDVRIRILRNVQLGRDLYDGFEYSSYGGAIRSVQTWRGAWKLFCWDIDAKRWVLTEAGIAALTAANYGHQAMEDS